MKINASIPCLLALLVFMISAKQGRAQDETILMADSSEWSREGQEVSTVIPAYVPRKALLLSAIMPGLGQAYNGKYWKMPFVYGGFIGFGYMISYYNEFYNTFKYELFRSIEDPSFVPPSGASNSQLRSLVDRARRERDYMIVLTGLFYFLQIADAHIDAHLREFDLNPGLQVKMTPSFEGMPGGQSIGMGIAIKF